MILPGTKMNDAVNGERIRGFVASVAASEAGAEGR